MQFLIALLVLCVVTAVPTKAKADDPGMEVVKKMKAAFEPAHPSTRTVEIRNSARSTYNSNGRTVGR